MLRFGLKKNKKTTAFYQFLLPNFLLQIALWIDASIFMSRYTFSYANCIKCVLTFRVNTTPYSCEKGDGGASKSETCSDFPGSLVRGDLGNG